MGIDLDQGFSGCILQVRRRVERHGLVGPSDRVFLVGRDEAGHGPQAGGRFGQRRGGAAGLEPGQRRRVRAGGLTQAPSASMSATRRRDVGAGRLERHDDRFGNFRSAWPLPGAIGFEQATRVRAATSRVEAVVLFK